jgi:COMPASS component SWD2
MPASSIPTSRPPREREAIKLSDTIHRFRPSKAFQNISPGAEITSLDFDDKGELCIASADDETLQLYDCIAGKHSKTLYSKKYGCHLAKFTHTSTNVIYASTKGDDTIRYLSLHDNTYIRYFRGHNRIVNSLEVSPVDDQFISASHDDTVRLWDLKSPNCHGILNINAPSLAAFDPSGIIFAVASHAGGSIMLYDLRNYDKQPFTTFTVSDDAYLSSFSYPARMPPWSKLEFSNDGKLMLLGTRGHAHYIIDSFAENTAKFLYRVHRPKGPTSPNKSETSGDVCFTPDGRYIIGGQGERSVGVWDTAMPPDDKKSLKPFCELVENGRSMASCVAFNPRTNLFASAHKEAVSLLEEGKWVVLIVVRIGFLATGTTCAGSAAVAAAVVGVGY